jgi:hypothetical protein
MFDAEGLGNMIAGKAARQPRCQDIRRSDRLARHLVDADVNLVRHLKDGLNSPMDSYVFETGS